MTTLLPPLLRPFRCERSRIVGDLPRGIALPHDGPHAHSSGENPDRVLVFGNGIAVGWGVGTHELAIPGQLARALSARTGRGCDVDLLADTRWSIETAVEALIGRDLAGYDAIVVVMGASDAFRLMPLPRWTAALGALLDHLELMTSEAACVTIMGIEPLSATALFGSRPGGLGDVWAESLNECSHDICEGRTPARFVAAPEWSRPGAVYATTSSAGERFRSPERYSEWASAAAAQVAPSLDAQSAQDRPARLARNLPQPLGRRMSALRELHLLDSPREKRFDDIVRRAQQMFGTAGAAFSVIDENRQWNKAMAGAAVTELPLQESFCATTIEHAMPLVIEDAWSDDRVEGIGAPMRFYAGHPVEAADGTRIGALCVFDDEPRDAGSVDIAVLRELALAIQRELAVQGDD